ncbi:MAG TPA: DUF4965 domain-containing protein [Verrucomicrobiae bacterium]|jgi:hypothetical protein
MMNRFILTLAIAVSGILQVSAEQFRPPSVPLVTFDPYLSIWSAADHLTDRPTQHWTTRHHSLDSLIRVDGASYRLMGNEPESTPALPQTSLQVTPTSSIYDFENEKVHVTLRFLRPALPEDLDAMALPLSYITWEIRSVDGQKHQVSLYDSTSSQLVVNKTDEKVDWSREKAGKLTLLRCGTAAQDILGSRGDDHRIDWGYAYAAANSSQSKSAIGADQTLLNSFVSNGTLPGGDDPRMPRAVNDEQPVMAFVFDLGEVAAKPVERQVIVAYDELYAIKYFGKRLLPYWKRNGATAAQMLQKASRDYASFARKCADFDERLVADLTKVGGTKYAQMCALAYRQCACACGLAADANKQPLFFTKENTSNGDIATVDVFFPMDPQWVLLSPTLAKATLVPILSYAASSHWRFPNAPHDLGTYPIASGTDDGGEGMPVEESGNMLILCDAIAQMEGNARFVEPWWPKLTQWAEYLKNYGLDPEDQLCTDDFMGHLAHNANLSIKAILGLACYGDLCRMRGDEAAAKDYQQIARTDAAHWQQVAADDGHFRLAFDKPHTWSQEYNLVWDKILGLHVFSPEVAQKEVAFYKTKLQPYGLPLDSRTKLTKSDWTMWSATLADNQDDFETLISPMYEYLNHTTSRSPFADSYITDDIHSDGMHARPVIGGVFIKMLADRDIWTKWAHADKTKVGNWAPLPPAPKIIEVIPTSKTTPAIWHYTTQKPSKDWMKADFDASSWKQGPGSFGTEGTPGAAIGTKWDTDDIWLRREVTLPDQKYSDLQFYVDHDEDVEIYVNGVMASREGGFTSGYVPLFIRPNARELLKPNATVTLAVHCHQTTGGQNIDVGLANIIEPK